MKLNVLYPGGMKPFHDGHLSLLESYISNNDNIIPDTVYIIISPKPRAGISAISTEEFLNGFNFSKISKSTKIIIQTAESNPIATCYGICGNCEDNDTAFVMATSEKGDDAARAEYFKNSFSEGGKYYNENFPARVININVKQTPLLYKRTDKFNNYPVSSTVVRNDIYERNYDNFRTAYTYMLDKEIITEEQLKTYYEKLCSELAFTKKDFKKLNDLLQESFIDKQNIKIKKLYPMRKLNEAEITQKLNISDMAVDCPNVDFNVLRDALTDMGGTVMGQIGSGSLQEADGEDDNVYMVIDGLSEKDVKDTMIDVISQYEDNVSEISPESYFVHDNDEVEIPENTADDAVPGEDFPAYDEVDTADETELEECGNDFPAYEDVNVDECDINDAYAEEYEEWDAENSCFKARVNEKKEDCCPKKKLRKLNESLDGVKLRGQALVNEIISHLEYLDANKTADFPTPTADEVAARMKPVYTEDEEDDYLDIYTEYRDAWMSDLAQYLGYEDLGDYSEWTDNEDEQCMWQATGLEDPEELKDNFPFPADLGLCKMVYGDEATEDDYTVDDIFNALGESKKMVSLKEALKAFEPSKQKKVDAAVKNIEDVIKSVKGQSIGAQEVADAFKKLKAEQAKLKKIEKNEEGDKLSIADVPNVSSTLKKMAEADPSKAEEIKKFQKSLKEKVLNALENNQDYLHENVKVNGKSLKEYTVKELKKLILEANSTKNKLSDKLRDTALNESVDDRKVIKDKIANKIKLITLLDEELTYRVTRAKCLKKLNEEEETDNGSNGDFSEEDLAQMFGAGQGEETPAEDTEEKKEDTEEKAEEETEEKTEEADDEVVDLARVIITLKDKEAAEDLKQACVDAGIPEDAMEIEDGSEEDEEATEETEGDEATEETSDENTEELTTGEETESDAEETAEQPNESVSYKNLRRLFEEDEAEGDAATEETEGGEEAAEGDAEEAPADEEETEDAGVKFILADTDHVKTLAKVLDDYYGITKEEFEEMIGGEIVDEESDDAEETTEETEEEKTEETSDDKAEEGSKEEESPEDDIDPAELFKGL